MSRQALLLFILALVVLLAKADDVVIDDATTVSTESAPTFTPSGDYQVPTVSDPSKVVFLETFQENPSPRWVETKNPKYSGQEWKWAEAPGQIAGIKGDKGIIVAKEAKHHAIAAPVLIDTTNKDFVFQYEVKYEKNLQCSGAYVKLLDAQDLKLEDFDDKTPYIIMFGPDYCQPTDKVHFIFRHYNPISKQWQEKHLKNAPLIKNDQLSHLYTLIVRKDNTFEILIDNESARSGNLLDDFDPPVIPPKEIDDPEDKKPADWVDQELIDDTNATKPEDWDENEPLEIPDVNDKKPETWLDNEPAKVADPEVKKPADWSDEEDGKWEAPLIDNPKCKQVGCGEWKPKNIKNPNYKGKWKAPQIKNPAYKGAWKPKQIPNPNYFEDRNPHNFPKIGAIGIEILANQNNIMFDNILVTHDAAIAKDFAKKTWAIKFELQKKQQPKTPEGSASGDNPLELVKNFLAQYWIAIVVTVIALFAGTCLLCCRGSSKKHDFSHVQLKPAEEEEDEPVEEDTTSTSATATNTEAPSVNTTTSAEPIVEQAKPEESVSTPVTPSKSDDGDVTPTKKSTINKRKKTPKT